MLGCELLAQVFAHLDIVETDYFGLQVISKPYYFCFIPWQYLCCSVHGWEVRKSLDRPREVNQETNLQTERWESSNLEMRKPWSKDGDLGGIRHNMNGFEILIVDATDATLYITQLMNALRPNLRSSTFSWLGRCGGWAGVICGSAWSTTRRPDVARNYSVAPRITQCTPLDWKQPPQWSSLICSLLWWYTRTGYKGAGICSNSRSALPPDPKLLKRSQLNVNTFVLYTFSTLRCYISTLLLWFLKLRGIERDRVATQSLDVVFRNRGHGGDKFSRHRTHLLSRSSPTDTLPRWEWGRGDWIS